MKKKLLIFSIVVALIMVCIFLYFAYNKEQKDIPNIFYNRSGSAVGNIMGVSGVFDETGNVYVGSKVIFKLRSGEEVGYMLREDTTVEPSKYHCLGVRDCASWKSEQKVLFKDYDDLQHKLECKTDATWCRQDTIYWQIEANAKNELLNIKEKK